MRWWGYIILFGSVWLMLSWFASSVGLAENNDTAFSTNILPNAGTTTSSKTNSNLDGVQSGSTGNLTNNSTHNGFTITCETQVSNACGRAFNGELEASHDMTVTATGSLVGIEGTSTPDGVSHTSTQIKLNGGINLTSSIAVQSCEHNASNFTCGNSTGAVDSYTLVMKVKDSNGNTLATSTQIRTTDSGYNANERVWNDNLHYNGVHANQYEWSWTGVDGSQSTSTATLGPNLLGAEMALDFPTEDYEPLSAQEIKDMNEGLGTANLNESEIWNVISGLEESIGEKLNLETGGAVTSVELTEEFKIVVYTAPEAKPKEVAKVQEVVQTMNKSKTVETLKQEVIKEVIKESKTTTTEVVKNNSKQEVVKNGSKEKTVKNSSKQAIKEKTVKSKLALTMDKIDAKVKNPVKNLQLKNLVKIDAMTEAQGSLASYNIVFYAPKDIYLDQINITDNRLIYNGVQLVSYINNDTIGIKERTLNELNINKQRILIELKELQNG